MTQKIDPAELCDLAKRLIALSIRLDALDSALLRLKMQLRYDEAVRAYSRRVPIR